MEVNTMGLKTMSLLAAATVSASGGTALAFADDGVSISNGVHLIVPADADYQTRRQVTVKYRQPTVDTKTGVYSKDKKSICLALPKVLLSGQVVFNTIRIEREVHPSLTAAEALELCNLGAQMLVDADVTAFWANGSLS
jgi:hypothetical protein